METMTLKAIDNAKEVFSNLFDDKFEKFTENKFWTAILRCGQNIEEFWIFNPRNQKKFLISNDSDFRNQENVFLRFCYVDQKNNRIITLDDKNKLNLFLIDDEFNFKNILLEQKGLIHSFCENIMVLSNDLLLLKITGNHYYMWYLQNNIIQSYLGQYKSLEYYIWIDKYNLLNKNNRKTIVVFNLSVKEEKEVIMRFLEINNNSNQITEKFKLLIFNCIKIESCNFIYNTTKKSLRLDIALIENKKPNFNKLLFSQEISI